MTANLFTIEDIARACHEINAAYCRSIGDTSQPTWEGAPIWQKDSAINGVIYHLENPDATPEESHAKWMDQKIGEGWTYGQVKDPVKKEHPSMVPFHALPLDVQSKDHVFKGIVETLKPYLIAPFDASKERPAEVAG